MDVRPKLDCLLKNHEAVASLQEDVHDCNIAVVPIADQPVQRFGFILGYIDDDDGRQLFQKFGHLRPE
ncbi:hypothetical protein ASC76_17990 [Rhizobacter sp. Root404]|nr:hypothetical protein ASC76_17990 [Rhizobacter sp. Root404]